MKTKDLYKGTIETFIYQLLSEHQKMYGYELSKYIKERTNGNLEITESTLYPTLHKLEAAGHLTIEIVNIGNRVRKYYSLTPEGNEEAKNKIFDLQEFINVLTGMISGTPKLAIN